MKQAVDLRKKIGVWIFALEKDKIRSRPSVKTAPNKIIGSRAASVIFIENGGVASPTQSQATKNSSSADTSLSGANVKKFLCADENGRYARMEKCLPKKATLIQYSPDALSDFFNSKF